MGSPSSDICTHTASKVFTLSEFTSGSYVLKPGHGIIAVRQNSESWSDWPRVALGCVCIQLTAAHEDGFRACPCCTDPCCKRGKHTLVVPLRSPGPRGWAPVRVDSRIEME